MKRTHFMALWISTSVLLAAGCGKKEGAGAGDKEPAIGRSDVPVAEPDSVSKLIGELDSSDINKERTHSSILDPAILHRPG